MGYKIYNKNGIMLAEFLFKHDRDICLDLMDEDGNLIKEKKKWQNLI